VDEAWLEPPVSSEQLLHPDKYRAREPPESVEVPSPPPGAAMRLIYRDIEGEQTLRILFEEWLPTDRAALCASDWAGDRLAVYSGEGQEAFAWVIRYDDEAAAIRAMEAMGRWQEHARSAPPPSQKGTVRAPYCGEHPTRGPLAMARRARDIAVVGGPSGLARACGRSTRWLSTLLPPRPPATGP
jgi:hypothetical protein